MQYDFMNPGGNQNNQNGAMNWMQALDFSGNRTAVPGSQTGTGIGGITDKLSEAGIGMNMPTFQLGIGALGALNGIWQGRQANSLARDQFNLARNVTNTNLNNQIQSYNTALEDRARSRGVMEGRSGDYTDEYIERNRLSR